MCRIFKANCLLPLLLESVVPTTTSVVVATTATTAASTNSTELNTDFVSSAPAASLDSTPIIMGVIGVLVVLLLGVMIVLVVTYMVVKRKGRKDKLLSSVSITNGSFNME